MRFIRFAIVLCLGSGWVTAQDDPLLPGAQGYLLPNGWTLTPAGRQIDIPDLPTNAMVEPSGTHAFVLTSGWNEHGISVIDVLHNRKTQTVQLKTSWLGLQFDSARSILYVSGGTGAVVEMLAYDEANRDAPLTLLAPIELDTTRVVRPYLAGMALSHDGGTLFVADAHNQSLIEVDVETRRTRRVLALDGVPYMPALSMDGKTIYVSLWDKKQVALVDVLSGTVRKHIDVGSHPNDVKLTPDGQRLFVANANDNSVSVIDLTNEEVSERIITTLYPKAPEGSTPNALTVSSDGRFVLVANGDNNNLAWIDVTEPGRSEIRGFIPTGWYPSAVGLSPDNSRIIVGNGKGGTSAPNPRGPQPGQGWTHDQEYVGKVITGTVSLIYTPQPTELARYTRRVYRNTPYRDHLLEQTQFASPVPDIVPDKVGKPSKAIEYVLYIIKENRTYDQILGDMPEGNGDASLTLFPEGVTPNHHALAREFQLLDNFYVDAEVSLDGHAWSTAAYATDATEKTWPAQYARRGGLRPLYDKLYTPDGGFIWDLCAAAGISYRSYGEWVVEKDGKIEGRFPGLKGKVHPTYSRKRSNEYTDIERANDWIEEFRKFEKAGTVPRFQVLSLPDDHTSGGRTGAFTPFAQMGRNDLGLARIVEAASKSSLWPKMAIFVVEDDAQNGPDHVDAHRTVAYVISPYSRLRRTESTFYTTSSMLRTMELILGLPPMSQYDAAATPMFECFTADFDPTPYVARPATVDLEALNASDGYGARISDELPLADVDEAPDDLFSEIIWKAIKGADSEMPPPVRRARLVPLSSIANYDREIK